MDHKNKVSVIIPAYNRAGFLPDAIHSIINQTYDNIEIIIVDDGSEDNTYEVVKSFQKRFPIVSYYQNERAKGPSGARNTGILKSSGEYISFLDSDDVWLEGHLTTGMRIFQKYPDIDVLFGNFRVEDYQTGMHKYDFFSQKKLLHTLKGIELCAGVKLLQDNLFMALLQENFFHLASAIMRKSTMDGIMLDEAIIYAEDRDFAIQLYKKKATFAYRQDPVFVLYSHDSSLCSASADSTQPILISHIHLLEKYLTEYSLSADEKEIAKKLLAVKMSSNAYLYSKEKDYTHAFSSVFNSFKYDLSMTQIKDLLKVFMTVIYVPKSI